MYSIAVHSETNQVITTHNGKVAIFKLTNSKSEKIFEMKKGNQIQENFRIAVDSTGLFMAISCQDKYIRLRSTTNGYLFTKISCAEIISSLAFSLNNNYLIATSIEGYIYFFKVDLNKFKNPNPEVDITLREDPSNITNLTNITHNISANNITNITNNDSNLSRNQIMNKMKLLEKFLKSDDNSLANNEQVLNVLEKMKNMKNNSDLKTEDLNILASLNFPTSKESSNVTNEKLDNIIDDSLNIITSPEKLNPNENPLLTDTGVQFTNKITFNNNLVNLNQLDLQTLQSDIKKSNSNPNPIKLEEAQQEDVEHPPSEIGERTITKRKIF